MDAIELKRKGNLLYKEKKYEAAADCFKLLISQFPDSKDGYIGLAKVYKVIATSQDIVNALEPAADRIDSHQLLTLLADGYLGLVLDYERLDQITNAIMTCQRALEQRFEPVIAHYLGVLYLKACRDPETALDLFEQCLLHEPHARTAREGLILCYKQLGWHDKIGEAIKRWPQIHDDAG